MSNSNTILVAGLINIETTLKLEDGFPVHYHPVRYPFYGVQTTISGVGFNIARALSTIGDDIRFAALIGKDNRGTWVHNELKQSNIPTEGVLPLLDETPSSVGLYDESGKRAIFTDLKAIQEIAYPPDVIENMLDGIKLAVLTNINFTRPVLSVAQARGIPIATDVHAIQDLQDSYNHDYMAAATILFMSHENLPQSPHEWLRRVWQTYGTHIIVIGLGADGALLAVDGVEHHIPATTTRPVVNTIGAGDSLFSAFLSNYVAGIEPKAALLRAVIFASWKIGAASGADGFLTRKEWDQLYRQSHYKI